jgi:hypothetical protein
MRKFVIGFVSLCVVLAVYLLYSRFSSSPAIDTGPEIDIIKSASDANAVGLNNEIGKIGDVGVGTTERAYFTKLNEITKEIEEEYGFEKLLSKARDIWDVEKPYMNIYRRNFKCYITADKGKVQVETAVGRTTPKDATFSSNVVIHIFSGPSDDTKESFVYLDNIVFLSERSLLSTAGPVEFVSQDIRMDGTGMELIYNEQTERLEYFEIKDLESLQIKGSQAAMFSPGKVQEECDSRIEPQQPDKSLVAVETKKAETSEPEIMSQTEQKQGIYYKCTFNNNVLVDTPEQLIFAGDKLCINNIFWAEASSDQTAEDDADAANDDKTAAGTAETNPQADDSIVKWQASTPEVVEPNAPSEQLDNIVVTCDGAFIIVPRDSVRAQVDTAANQVEDAVSTSEPPGEFDEDTERTRFFTQRIDYNAATRDGVADGLSELTFYVGSATGTDFNEAPVPVKVTARKGAEFSESSNKIVFTGDCLVKMPQSGLSRPKDVTFTAPEITVNLPEDKSKQPDMTAAGPAVLVFYMPDTNDPNINTEPLPVTVNAEKQARFLAAANQIVFEGDSRCTMFQEDPNALVKYMLLSQQITVDLPADSNEDLSGQTAGIKHLTATGDVVRLAMTKTAKEDGTIAKQGQYANSAKLLGGVELKCTRFDYDAVRQEFIATGPGVIKLNNSKAPEPNEPVGRFSLRQPCWASIDGFDTLTYFDTDNRIVADAGAGEKLRIDYFPAVEGRYDEHITAQASAVEVILFEDPNGQMQLSTLYAKSGIKYEDKNNEFIGSELFYDHKTAILKVNGDETQPCYHNGALVESIEMNVETGKVKAEIVGPGILKIKR